MIFAPKRERCRTLARRRFVDGGLDGGKPFVDPGAHLRMGKHIEFILANRGEDARSDLRRLEPGLQTGKLPHDFPLPRMIAKTDHPLA
jgi:hypothetical protein